MQRDQPQSHNDNSNNENGEMIDQSHNQPQNNNQQPGNQDDWQSEDEQSHQLSQQNEQDEQEDEQQFIQEIGEEYFIDQEDINSQDEQNELHIQHEIQQQQKPYWNYSEKLDLEKVPKQVKNAYKSLLQGSQPLMKLIKVPKGKRIEKEVCAKIINRQETIVQCFDCQSDPSCIVCLDCFKNGKHQGHRYIVKKAFGGCCDCGDIEAWKQQGFCSKHSGKFKQFELDPKQVEEFVPKLQALFYIYFNLKLSNQKSEISEDYTKKLFQFLKQLNKDNVYFNKMLTVVLCEKLPNIYKLPEEISERTILKNLLTTKVTENHLPKWFELFIMMFSYYPLKLQILTHYISSLGSIFSGKKSSEHYASSISCQLLTSWNLVKQYSENNKIGLGQDFVQYKDKDQLINYYLILSSDINHITKLAEDAPFCYFKMHINSNPRNQQKYEGILNLFLYRELLVERVKKTHSEMSQTQQITTYISWAYVQKKSIQNFVQIVQHVKKDKQLILKLIKSLYSSCASSKEEDIKILCTLRPHERCLAIVLFQYFNCQLSQIPSLLNNLLTYLNVPLEKFQQVCLNSLNHILYTLFWYAKTQALSGLGQTVYNYLYFYKVNHKALSNSDILAAKVFMALAGTDNLQKCNHFQIYKIKNQNTLDQGEKISYINHILKIFRYCFVHDISQIFFADGLSEDIPKINEKVEQLLINSFKQHKNSMPLEVIKQSLLSLVQFPGTESSKKLLQNFCTVNNQNKTYSLRSVYEEKYQKSEGINYDDLWLPNAARCSYEELKKTVKQISKENMYFFRNLYNKNTFTFIRNFIQANGNNREIEPLLPHIVLVYQVYGQILKDQDFKQDLQFFKKVIVQNKQVIGNQVLVWMGLLQEQSMDIEQKSPLKQKVQSAKMKKLEEMKKKRELFLKNAQTTVSKQEEHTIKQQHNDHGCFICKKPLNKNSVYLVNLTIRNHEKLLGTGPGLECLSLNTCKHIFDYQCIEKKFKNKIMIDCVSCPLCKTTANVLFPASFEFSKQIAEQAAQKVAQILNSLDEGRFFYEEVIKSFYHYYLLCKVDFQKSFQKRSQVYQLLFNMICKSITPDQFEQNKDLFLQGKISTHFETFLQESNSSNAATHFAFQALRVVLESRGPQAYQESVVNFLQKNVNRVTNNPVKSNERKQEKESFNSEALKKRNWQFNLFFQNFFSSLLQFGNNLSGLKKQSQMSEKMQHETNKNISKQQQTITKFISLFMTSISNPKFELCQFQNFSKEIDFESISFKNKKLLIKLPEKYSQLENKRCSACKQITGQLCMCLLCEFQGCNHCKDGDMLTHIILKHGAIGATMNVQKGTVEYLSGERKVIAGKMYENLWGGSLEKSHDWENFALNSTLKDEIQRKLLLDDVPTRNVINQ